MKGTSARLGIPESPWSNIARKAIDPDDYSCQDTDLSLWVDGLDISDLRSALLGIAGELGGNFANAVLDFPQYDALLFGEESRDNRFGRNGEYTQVLNAEMRDLKRFWNIDSAGIQLLPFHGADVFGSVDRLQRLIEALYGVDASVARPAAEIVYEQIHAYPSLQGGDHPLFTFNAFAFTPPTGLEALGDRIIMGDGILQGMEAVGLGAVAPRAILGHEFGHHVQYDNDLFESDLAGAEATRRTELMADAFSTYFLTHKRGATLNAKRLLPSLQSFYQIGDCNFSSSGHHGTPNQRLNSSVWGSDLAASAQKKGHILPSLTVAELFERELPILVRPDAD
ncbi:hypothetical protein [Luteimonas aquatica]|uniref:hypothetical protein n=1 Tax=Luteimonas aquatica TaxID=450364 RepID=UPI001F5AD4FC|nr:hypothetical protein [Luteimonas aquatica]